MQHFTEGVKGPEPPEEKQLALLHAQGPVQLTVQVHAQVLMRVHQILTLYC